MCIIIEPKEYKAVVGRVECKNKVGEAGKRAYGKNFFLAIFPKPQGEH
jgi:hypothetical protein